LSLNYNYNWCCTGTIVGETNQISFVSRQLDYFCFSTGKNVTSTARAVKELLIRYDVPLHCLFIPTYSSTSLEEGLIGEMVTESLLRSGTYVGRCAHKFSKLCKRTAKREKSPFKGLPMKIFVYPHRDHQYIIYASAPASFRDKRVYIGVMERENASNWRNEPVIAKAIYQMCKFGYMNTEEASKLTSLPQSNL